MVNLTREKLVSLTEKYGNAFYLLDSVQFKKNYLDLTSEFEKIYPNFKIAYSYKTNYTPKFCRIVDECGGYAEVVSEMELEIARRIGVDARRTIWNGPIKNVEMMEEFLMLGGTVNVDSISEMAEIIAIANVHPESLFNIGIRCNFDVGDGVVSRFGFDVDGEDFSKAIELLKDAANVRLINLQCHFAKRNVEFWPARARGMAELTKRIAQMIGYTPDRVDIGGGLYGNMAESLKAQFSSVIPSYADYAMAAATVFAESFPNHEIELVIEPGSALVGDCMQFVGRIETIKKVRGKIFATVLASQKNISMSGVNPPLKVINATETAEHLYDVDIVGYTCIEGDVLYRGYSGKLAVGDFVVFSNCGSYSIVMKPPFILPNFPVLDICADDVELIKRQETFDDLFGTFVF